MDKWVVLTNGWSDFQLFDSRESMEESLMDLISDDPNEVLPVFKQVGTVEGVVHVNLEINEDQEILDAVATDSATSSD